jgi:hypothetical protein
MPRLFDTSPHITYLTQAQYIVEPIPLPHVKSVVAHLQKEFDIVIVYY